jgi:hypothetical protein
MDNRDKTTNYDMNLKDKVKLDTLLKPSNIVHEAKLK